MHLIPKLLALLAFSPVLIFALPTLVPREAEPAPAPGYGDYGELSR